MIWRGSQTVAGAPAAVARLRDAGCAVAFVTNSSSRTPAQVAAKLASHGIDDAEDLVISSAMAAAEMVEPGERVLALGGDGVVAALEARGAVVADTGSLDAVIVGIRSDFDYEMLTVAMRAVHAGARLIGTNDDATFPDADGLLPGNGALVAAVSTAAGVDPLLAGKPHQPIADLVRRRLGAEGIMVGDRPETDGLFARSLGYRFGLVLTGVVSASDLPVQPTPDVVADDLLALVDLGSDHSQ